MLLLRASRGISGKPWQRLPSVPRAELSALQQVNYWIWVMLQGCGSPSGHREGLHRLYSEWLPS